MSHTKGPWVVGIKHKLDIDCGSYGDLYSITNQEMPIAWFEQEPNRKLIEAAPDMLEALKAAKKDSPFAPSIETRRLIAAAISKAETK